MKRNALWTFGLALLMILCAWQTSCLFTVPRLTQSAARQAQSEAVSTAATKTLDQQGFGSFFEQQIIACFPVGTMCVQSLTLNQDANQHMSQAFTILQNGVGLSKPEKWGTLQQREIKPDVLAFHDNPSLGKALASHFADSQGNVRDIEFMRLPDACSLVACEVTVQPDLCWNKLFQAEKILAAVQYGVDDNVALPTVNDTFMMISINGDLEGFTSIAPAFARFLANQDS
ncbi:unnamed protein product [Symbiodinium sp. CCMP2592]|nr:unnamed protein product [Symbiodinium sp. CCMP2592]